MKRIIALIGLVGIFGIGHAQNEPIVGVWEKMTVGGPGGTLVARTNYIFTNRKLEQETVFSGVQQARSLSVICCIKVSNLKPIDIKEILSKYKIDEDFVEHMKSIKGADYIYEASPVDKSEWNPFMTTIMNIDKNPLDHSPYSTPVIAARLGGDDEKLKKLELGPTKTKLKISYTKDDRAVYEFIFNDKKTIFSEGTFAH
jgi:hypothetical protein